jgi:hypothetical protein
LEKVLWSFMFPMEKFTALEEFDKLKMQMGAGGNGQNKELYEDSEPN